MTRVRPASAGEAEALSALAIRSKAHWGYTDDFLRTVRLDLAITPAQIREWIVRVLDGDAARDEDTVVGFYAISLDDRDTAELERLFVEPRALGRGHGRRLFEDAVSAAAERGVRALTIASDPYAEGFYLRVGAVRVGDAPSPIPGRMLPLLRFDFA